MTVHRHFLIVIGRWKFENWHLYREAQIVVRYRKGPKKGQVAVRRWDWKKIF